MSGTMCTWLMHLRHHPRYPCRRSRPYKPTPQHHQASLSRAGKSLTAHEPSNQTTQPPTPVENQQQRPHLSPEHQPSNPATKPNQQPEAANSEPKLPPTILILTPQLSHHVPLPRLPVVATANLRRQFTIIVSRQAALSPSAVAVAHPCAKDHTTTSPRATGPATAASRLTAVVGDHPSLAMSAAGAIASLSAGSILVLLSRLSKKQGLRCRRGNRARVGGTGGVILGR